MFLVFALSYIYDFLRLERDFPLGVLLYILYNLSNDTSVFFGIASVAGLNIVEL